MYSEILSEIIEKSKLEIGDEVASKFFKGEYGLVHERFDIKTQNQADKLGKEIGRYELFSVPELLLADDAELEYYKSEIAKVLKSLIGKITRKSKILVVGLGNRHISSDSLGTKVVSRVNITFEDLPMPRIMAICPSVLGLTGIETYDIISGIVDKVKPTKLILIDSLCARNWARLGRSIQITTTGICPGSGIGNKRKCIDRTIGCDVISIGVPLLIYASTFVANALDDVGVNLDTLHSTMQSMNNSNDKAIILDILSSVGQLYNYPKEDMIVSAKDIEESVKILAKIIADSINIATGIKAF